MIAAILAVLAVALGGVYALDEAQAADPQPLGAGDGTTANLTVGENMTFALPSDVQDPGDYVWAANPSTGWDGNTKTLTASEGTESVTITATLGSNVYKCTVTITAEQEPDEPAEPVVFTNDPIWPSPEAEEDDERQYSDWDVDADWISDADTEITYWYVPSTDPNKAGWMTVLDKTVVDFDGIMETYRVKAQGPATVDAEDFVVTDLEIEFYNFRENFEVNNTVITPVSVNLDGTYIEMGDGTFYPEGLTVTLQGNTFDADTQKTKSYFKTINVPLIVKKANLTKTYYYEYTFNGLYQTPIEFLGGDNTDASTPYVHPNDCFGIDDLNSMVPEGVEIEWNYEGTTQEKYTNKYYAMIDIASYDKDTNGNYIDANGNIVTLSEIIVPYVVTITPSDSKLVSGTITIVWKIVPLSLDDIEFDIRNPYYDFDNEVRPEVVLTWYEPEDGPNGPAKHWISAEDNKYVNIDYTMPENYPYNMPKVKEYVYQQKVDDNGNPVWEKVAVPDEDAELRTVYEQKVDASGKPVFDAEGNIVYDTTKPVQIPDLDDDGNPQYVPDGDEQVQAVDGDGKPIFRHVRYEDGTFAYYQLIGDDKKYVYEVDEDGEYVLDANGNKIPVYDYDKPILVPVMEPKMKLKTKDLQVYVMKYEQVAVWDYSKPVMMQSHDQYERPMYVDFEYEVKKYETGETVFQQLVNNKGEPQFNKDGTPKWDTTKPVLVPVMEQIFEPQIDDRGNIVYQDDGVTPVWTTTTVKDAKGNDVYAPKYDTTSNPVNEPKYVESVAEFTATQVGYPTEEDEFKYGIHITGDGSYYEFDTADYKAAVDKEGNPVFAQEIDSKGKPVTNVVDGKTVPKYDTNKPLYKYSTEIVDVEKNKSYYLVNVGELYNADRFTWKILPLQVEREWTSIDFEKEEASIIVPAGYTHLKWQGNKLAMSEPLAKDYEILAYDGKWNEDDYENWNFDGQWTFEDPYYYLDMTRVGFAFDMKAGANFYPDVVFIDLSNFGMMLNVDTITVVGDLTSDDLEELKRAVHFFPMDMYPWFQSFTIDDFNITVVNGDGEVVVFQDQIVRNILASDWYTITVTGNMENGYYGFVFGSFFINKEAPADEVTGFKYEDYTAVGIKGVMITGYTGTDKDVVIPDYIDGKKVLAIGDNAFKNNKDITSVTFGKYVRTVGFKAFAGCSALKSVEFNDDLQVIGAYAFYLDKAITKVVFGNGLRAVRENAFSVDFVSGIASENLAGKELYSKRSTSNVDLGIIPVYGNYVDDAGKSQYYAKDALAGRIFIIDEGMKSLIGVPEDANALVGIPLDVFFEPERIKDMELSNKLKEFAAEQAAEYYAR